MLGGLFSACADTKKALSNRKRISLAGALLEVQASRTETEVIKGLGPPNSTGNFDPGNKADPNIVNRFPRKEWTDLYVFVPPTSQVPLFLISSDTECEAKVQNQVALGIRL